MLRACVALLLLANLGFYAWTQGWLDDVVGVRASGDREPERLARQVHPAAVKVLAPQAALGRGAEPRLACLEAGPFAPADAAAVEAALSTVLPAGSWTTLPADRPAVWIVYMGRFATSEVQRLKEEELARLQVAFEPVKNAPELEPGLSLGRFDQRAAADEALAQLKKRGVRSARVAELVKPASLQMLRIESADADLAATALRLKLNALGKGFGACARS